MARYDYHCPSCNISFEVEHPMGEHPVVLCPNCGAAASHVFSANAISFKGSGFYNTDQRSGSSSTEASSAPAETSGAQTSTASQASKTERSSTESARSAHTTHNSSGSPD